MELIRIGSLTVGRFILGSNPFSGFSHQGSRRDSEMTHYFTTARINALIAPRPHLSLAGNYDPLTPAAGLDRLDRELSAVYRAEGAPDAWQLRRYETGHFETAAMRAEALAFLERWL